MKYICPNNLYFAVDNGRIGQCDTCPLFYDCKKIKEDYQIKDENEEILLSKANFFIKDVFGFAFGSAPTIVFNCVKFGLIKKTIGAKYKKYKITYKQIFELMFLPFHIVLEKGRLHRGEKNG